MEEKDFEKKSKKIIWIVVVVAILLIVALIAGILYFNSKIKGDDTFKTSVKDVFKMIENSQEELAKAPQKGKIEVEVTAELDTNNAELKTLNPIIKAIKLNTVAEVDIDKKVLNQNITATYDGEQVISLDALLQDEGIYVYLNDIFDKYIDLTSALTETLSEETGLSALDFNTIFAKNDNVFNKNLLKDIENIVLDTIEKKEIKSEKTELNGEKVKKSICTLTAQETVTLVRDIMAKIAEYEQIEEFNDVVDELNYLLEEGDFSQDNYIEFSLYTKGMKNEFEKLTAKVYQEKSAILTIDVIKEENKTTITLKAGGALLAIVAEKEKDTTTVKFLVNLYEAKVSTATELAKIVVNKENDNAYSIQLIVHVGEIMAIADTDYQDTKLDVILNIKYKENYDVDVEKRDVSNSVAIEDLTEEELQTILNNIQKNEILKALIDQMGLIETEQEIVESLEEAV